MFLAPYHVNIDRSCQPVDSSQNSIWYLIARHAGSSKPPAYPVHVSFDSHHCDHDLHWVHVLVLNYIVGD